ncbi:hypothetical protein [Megalodesulfovibrio paquesii]
MMDRQRPSPASERAAARRILADLFPDAFLTGREFDLSLLYAECGVCGRPLVWSETATRLVLRRAGVDPGTLDYSHLLRTNGCGRCSPELEDATISLVKLM